MLTRSSAKRKRGRPRDPSLPARRREQILAIAARLFSERGYADTDLALVARRAGLGKGTIYRYFPSKRQIFRMAVMREMEQLGAAADQAIDAVKDGIDYLRRRLVAFLKELGKRPELVELLVIDRAEARRSSQTPAFFIYRQKQLPRWRPLLRRLGAQGRIRDLDPDLIAAAMAVLAYGAAISNRFVNGGRPLGAYAEPLADLLLHGICTKERAKRTARSSR